MTLVELLVALDRLPPEMWDVVVPHSHITGRELEATRSNVRSLNGQPTPPVDPHRAAASLVRDVVLAGSIAETIGANGAATIHAIVDDWCLTGWPRWPFPVPVGPGGEPHPDWSPSTGLLVGALTLAAAAARMTPGSLRDAAEQGASQLLDAAQR